MNTFKAFRTEEVDGQFVSSIQQINKSTLPENEVLIQVLYSGINYKDLLSSRGNKGVTKKYPHTPGIDAAGIVVKDNTASFAKGTEVVVMGYDLGMNLDGGFAEYISVPAAWVMAKPNKFTLKETMLIGTSGFTAALGISKMLRMGQTPADGAVIVSGATGGVGSFAVQMLATLGFEVHAMTGKEDAHTSLKALGAKEILKRSDVLVPAEKPLLRPRWAGALDTVGGETLASIIKQCQKEGSVATCGNVGGMGLALTVLPFILNGVNLLGINAADTQMAIRQKVWLLLEEITNPQALAGMGKEIALEEVAQALTAIEDGSHSGRFLVRINSDIKA
jgi:alcohol dehydrogenase